MWSASVVGPVIHVTVPAVRRPASSSSRGPSAATSTGGAAMPGGRLSDACTAYASPVVEAASPRNSGNNASR